MLAKENCPVRGGPVLAGHGEVEYAGARHPSCCSQRRACFIEDRELEFLRAPVRAPIAGKNTCESSVVWRPSWY